MLVGQLKNQIFIFSREVKVMRIDVEDLKNSNLERTLVFKNFLPVKKRETWTKSKDILAEDNKSAMPPVEESV